MFFAYNRRYEVGDYSDLGNNIDKYVPIIQSMCDCTKGQATKIMNKISNELQSHYRFSNRFSYGIVLFQNIKFLFSKCEIKIPYEIFKKFIFDISSGTRFLDESMLDMLFEIIESDKYKEGLIPNHFMNNFIEILESFGYKTSRYNLGNMSYYLGKQINNILILFVSVLTAKNVKVSSEDCDLIFSKINFYMRHYSTTDHYCESELILYISNILKKNYEFLQDDIRGDLEELNERFCRLGQTDIYFLNYDKYYRLYSLLFSNNYVFVTDKVKLYFLKKTLEFLENKEQSKFDSFYQLVTSKGFMENKISNTILQKTLQTDYIDKYFEEIHKTEAAFKYSDYYVDTVILGLLTSEAYYEGQITEESLDILFDEKYRVIKIMIALLLFNKYYSKHNYNSLRIQEIQNNMDLIIALLNYSKKEELCEMFESRILPSSHSKVEWIPTYNGEGDINNLLNPELDWSVCIMIGESPEKNTAVDRFIFPQKPLHYNPISRLIKEIREWLSTERVLPFATRPLIRTLQDK